MISILNVLTKYFLAKTCILKNNFKGWVIYFYLKNIVGIQVKIGYGQLFSFKNKNS